MSDKTVTDTQKKEGEKPLDSKKEEEKKAGIGTEAEEEELPEGNPGDNPGDKKPDEEKKEGAKDGKDGDDEATAGGLPEDKDELIKLLVERLQDAESKIRSTQELVSKQKEENETMAADLERVNKEIQEELEKDQKELEEKVNKELKLTLQQSKDATEEAQKQEEILKDKLKEHETVIGELETNLHDLRYEHRDLMVTTNKNKARNEQLKATFEHVKGQNDALEEHKKAKADKLKAMEDEIEGIKKMFANLDGARQMLGNYLEGNTEDPATFMYYLESNEPKIQSDLTADYDEKTKTLNSTKDISKVKKFSEIQEETTANSPQTKAKTVQKTHDNGFEERGQSRNTRENMRYTNDRNAGKEAAEKRREVNEANDFWGGGDDDEDIQMEYNFAKNLPNEDEDVEFGSPQKRRAGAYENSPGGRHGKGTRQPKRVVAKNPRQRLLNDNFNAIFPLGLTPNSS